MSWKLAGMTRHKFMARLGIPQMTWRQRRSYEKRAIEEARRREREAS